MRLSLFASSPVSDIFAPRVRIACSLCEASASHPTQGGQELSHDGDAGPTLYVFKGSGIPYRTVLKDVNSVVESVSDIMPRGALVTVRRHSAGVETTDVFEWAIRFVNHVRDLTANRRKVLLIYDGYRSHMSFKVLHFFEQMGWSFMRYPIPHLETPIRWMSLCSTFTRMPSTRPFVTLSTGSEARSTVCLIFILSYKRRIMNSLLEIIYWLHFGDLVFFQLPHLTFASSKAGVRTEYSDSFS